MSNLLIRYKKSIIQVCRKMRDDPFGHKSIGSLDSVTYTVNDPTFVNVSATYSGPEG